MYGNGSVRLVWVSGLIMGMRYVVLSMSLLLMSLAVKAEWVSDIDQRYSEKSPSLFAKVMEAKKLVDEARGRKDYSRKAIVTLLGVINEDPKFVPAYVQYARADANLGLRARNEFTVGTLTEMELLLRKALSIEPNYDYALVMMGYTKMYQEKYDESEKYYNQAKSLGTGYPYLMSQMAQLATRRGEYRKAIELASDGYEKNKSNPGLASAMVTELIFAYEKLPGNNDDDLDKWMSIKTKLRPEDPSAWLDYANLRLYKFGDYKSAMEYARHALEITNHPKIRMVLAAAYYARWSDLKVQHGNSIEVEEAFVKALSFWHPSEDLIQNMSGSDFIKLAADMLLAEVANRNIQVYRTIKGENGMTIYIKNVEQEKGNGKK